MLRIVFFPVYWIPTFVGMTAVLTFLENECGFLETENKNTVTCVAVFLF
jgi:hypothetical protein